MAKRNKEAPYKELGDLIVKWRSKRVNSALALFKVAGKEEKPFTFSYSSYVDFERGFCLPSIEQALEIAAFFEESREAMALMWAKIQMPADLRRLFSPYASMGIELPAQPAIAAANPDAGKDVPHLNLENTWILGPRERELMLAHPWVIDALLLMATEFPDPTALEDFGHADVIDVLQPCIQQGRIEHTEAGLKLTDPFFHLPRNREWQQVRRQNILRASAVMMDDITQTQLNEGAVFQDAVTRKLTAAEAKAMVAHLERLKDTFFKTPPQGQRQVYSFTAVLAPRRLRAK